MAVPLELPQPSKRLLTELHALPGNPRVAIGRDLSVFAASGLAIEALLHELGRLRELCNRVDGSGTGRSRDLDVHDVRATHLVLWDHTRERIAGAIRVLPLRTGIRPHLETRFHLDECLTDAIGPAVELGRRFVVPEYRGEFAAERLVWQGIGTWLGRHPWYRRMLASVRVADTYHPASRRLVAQWVLAPGRRSGFSALARPRQPFLPADERQELRTRQVADLRTLAETVTRLEREQRGLPVLLQHYARLGGRAMAVGADPAGGLEVLCVLDLLEAERDTLYRFLGPGAQSLLAHHGFGDDELAWGAA
ncbi:MAG: GNAT family N-acetyltransferase [Deltaproteobacteria bacterium]|nr:MAG: GNAT family N-acetyltransferase [Deltaproteobacteria bacterium]